MYQSDHICATPSSSMVGACFLNIVPHPNSITQYSVSTHNTSDMVSSPSRSTVSKALPTWLTHNQSLGY